LGREREVEEIARLLAVEGVRLLTLTGTGGIGKTRLALEAARKAGEYFPDGVSFVALAPLGAAARLWGAAEALLQANEVMAYPHASDRSVHQRQVTDARVRLETGAWQGAWAQGRAMTLEQAVEYALEGQNPAPELPRARENESRRADPNP
jgi:hypothetical protein